MRVVGVRCVLLAVVLASQCGWTKADEPAKTGGRGGEVVMAGLAEELLQLSVYYSQLQGKMSVLRELLSVGAFMRERWSCARQCMSLIDGGYDEPSLVKLGTPMATVSAVCSLDPTTASIHRTVTYTPTVTSTLTSPSVCHTSTASLNPTPSSAYHSVTPNPSQTSVAHTSTSETPTSPTSRATTTTFHATTHNNAPVNPSIFPVPLPTVQTEALILTSKCEMGWYDFTKHFKDDKFLGIRVPLSDYLLDASGKVGAGVLEGNTLALGSYDECFSLPRTQYCEVPIGIGHSVHNATTFRVGMCLPRGCVKSDVLDIVKEINQTLEAIQNVLFSMNVSMNVLNSTEVYLFDSGKVHCITDKKPRVSGGAVGVVLFIGVLLACIAVSSVIDWLKHSFKHCCHPLVSLKLSYEEKKSEKKELVEHSRKGVKAVEVEKFPPDGSSSGHPSFGANSEQTVKEKKLSSSSATTSHTVLSASVHTDESQSLISSVSSDSSHLSVTSSNLEREIEDQVEKPSPKEIATLLSIFKLVSALISTKQPPHAIRCLDGVRVISMFWVILAQTHYWVVLGSLLDNPLKVITHFGPTLPYQAIANATLAADTFFFLSGLLMAYHTLRGLKKTTKPARFAVQYYLHRYLRLTPTYAFVMFFFWLITMYLSDGPYYILKTGFHSHNYHACQMYWWTNLLYISNFYPTKMGSTCMEWTAWYLSNDWQFYIVSPLIIVLLYYFPPLGGVAIGLFFVGSFLTTGAITGVYDISASYYAQWNISNFQRTPDYVLYQDVIYTKPYARIAPYLVGIVMGYVFYRKYKITLNRVAGWIMQNVVMAIGGLLLVAPLLGLFNTWKRDPSDPESVLYITFSRFSWGLGVALVVLACEMGHGGTLNSILSLRIWVPLSRLTFSAFLVHPIILTIVFDSLRVPLHFTTITMIVYAVAAIVLCYGAAFVVAAVVEYPLARIERLIFKCAGFEERESIRLSMFTKRNKKG